MSNHPPFLIYTGGDLCYNTLNVFAEKLGEALRNLGEEVIFLNVEAGEEGKLAEYVGREYGAIIGFQTYLFDIYLPSKGCFLHDLMQGPKINIQLDHPIWMKNHYANVPANTFLFTHDRNYIAFANYYYPNLSGAYLFPPGGMQVRENAGIGGTQLTDEITSRKTMNLIFMGSYYDYRNYLPAIYALHGENRRIAGRFLSAMKKKFNATPEELLREILVERKCRNGQKTENEEGDYSDGISDREFLTIFDGLKNLIFCVMNYYREKVICEILEDGLTLDVYGDTWKNSPFASCENLRIHPALSPEESLLEMRKAKISLNIMSWHKDGYTERIANSFLNGACVLSDESTCLKEQYEEGKELLLFSLGEIQRVPAMIREALKGSWKEIAARGYKRGLEDTWDERAKLLLYYLYGEE